MHRALFGFGDRGTVLSTRESASCFARRNGVVGAPSVERLSPTGSTRTSVERMHWRSATGADVVLYTVHGGGHTLPQPRPSAPRLLGRTDRALKWTTCALLLGHGALGALTGKAMLTGHYAAIGLSPGATVVVGWFEIALALGVAVRPVVGLLVFVAAWKIATKSLFLISGAPIWELVERAGSFAAPLALAALGERTRPMLG